MLTPDLPDRPAHARRWPALPLIFSVYLARYGWPLTQSDSMAHTRTTLLGIAATGSRSELLATLQAIDPNGSWGDAESQADGLEPLTEAEAREALRSLASELDG